MHIILKQSSREGENDQILNMFYCPNQTIIRDWVKNWIKTDIKAKNEASDADKQQDITYEINDAETNFQLIKRYKKIHKGYIYNLSEKVSEIDYKISKTVIHSDVRFTYQTAQDVIDNNEGKLKSEIFEG